MLPSGLSRMTGTCHVRLLGGKGAARLPTCPTLERPGSPQVVLGHPGCVTSRAPSEQPKPLSFHKHPSFLGKTGTPSAWDQEFDPGGRLS